MKIYLEKEKLKLDFNDDTFVFDIEEDYKKIVKLITSPTIKASEFDTDSIMEVSGNKQVELILEYIDSLTV